ncbi:unnamed protein product [Choristocarpus tenellus]
MEMVRGDMDVENYSIPEGLEGNSAVVGEGSKNEQRVDTTITAFKSPKFRQIRAALVESTGPTQVLNFVMFPDPRYDIPIFGADLVTLPGAHLFLIDLQPARPGQALDGRWNVMLEKLKG